MSVRQAFNEMGYGLAPESDQEAREWLDAHKRRFGHMINGEWQYSRQSFNAINPATGENLARLARGSEKDVNAAVNAANAARGKWADLTGHERARFLYAIARSVQKHARLFATLESLDNGKPIRESRDIDIPLVVRHFYYHAGYAQIREQEYPDYVPVGVIGQIIPWNFPLLMLAWKVAPALAMGNTVILKAAEDTSLTALLFAEICQQAGLPPGVFNLVLGNAATGAALVRHDGVHKIAFTGSTVVGRQIRRTIAGSGKRLSLELGGKSPYIVFEDADMDSAIEGLVDAIWFNQGQVCCAGSRLLIQESIADRFIRQLKRRMSRLIVGDSLDKNTDIGAIVSDTQLKRIQELVTRGVAEGAELWQPSGDKPDEGCFYPPTLLTGVEPANTIAQEEIFGPVLVALSFRTPAEAVELANNTRYGLAANIWTENINEAMHIAAQVKAGTIWINSANTFDASVGFGGYRESGFGREGGAEGVLEYLQRAAPAAAQPFEQRRMKKRLPSLGGSIDRTPKQYIGGKQTRPDSGYSDSSRDAAGNLIAELPKGNRKDARNAVEAARAASGWSAMTGHQRAQVMYFVAENLEYRREEFVRLIECLTGQSVKRAGDEFDQALSRLFTCAAYADKYEGSVRHPDKNRVALAMQEPLGVIAIAAPEESALLGLVSTVFAAAAMGNRIVLVPSQTYALMATHLYQVLDTSDMPGGVINIICGQRTELNTTLAGHGDVDGFWCWDSRESCAVIEKLAAENMKRTWLSYGYYRDWHDDLAASGREFFEHAVEVKNIWVPYGV